MYIVNNKINYLGNKESIINALFRKLNSNYEEQAYVFQFFSSSIGKEASDFSESEIRIIKKGLQNGNKLFYDFAFDYIDFLEDTGYIELFGNEYKECKSKIEENEQTDELPFKEEI